MSLEAADQNVKGSQIDIRGDYTQEDAYDKEYNNIRNLQNGFKHKKKTLRKMKVVAEKLAEDHKDFLIEKIQYEKEIETFNQQVKCASEPNTAGCDAFFAELGVNGRKTSGYAQSVKKSIERKRAHLEHCLSRGKGTNGTINFLLSIEKTGLVSHMALEDMKYYKNRTVLRCVSNLIQKIKFPKTPNGRRVKVRTPFRFSSKNYAYKR